MGLCPPAEQLKRFLDDGLDNQLDGAALAEIGAHVESCTACQRVLDELTRRPKRDQRREQVHGAAAYDAGLLERLKASVPVGTKSSGPDPDAMTTSAAGDGGRVEADSFTLARRGNAETSSGAGWASIEGFRIIREIGRGGMGVVYEAEEKRLSRHVALKVLPASALLQPKQIQRFEREARLAAGLHHTHIVPVYGSGTYAEYHYYFMQYIAGVGLDAVLRELRQSEGKPESMASTVDLAALTDRGRLAYRSLAKIGLDVAEALDYAHRHGVLHRDIKPSNLLLDAESNVWVTDFGLAKPLEADEFTSTGDVPGTIRYMAPERFAGRCDERSDLYSLGLTLYELAALRPGYEARDGYELMERMRREDPPRLRKLDPRVPLNLETIIHKAMARDAGARYASASELAADLRRFLEERPIVARRASVPERLVRWCRRNPWAAAFLVALFCGTIGSLWQAIRATRAEAAARTDRDRAERSRDRALDAVRKLLLFDSANNILFVEEARPYRRALIDAGLRASEELVRELEGDPRAEVQLAAAYYALAQLQNERGDKGPALESARKAVEMGQALFDCAPDAYSGRLLGSALNELSAFLPDLEASRDAARRSTAVWRTLLERYDGPERYDWAGSIATNHYNTGDRLDQGGRPNEAVEEFEAARAECAAALRERGPAFDTRTLLVKIDGHLCRTLAIVGRRDDAIAAGRRAVELGTALLRERPDDFGVAMDLDSAYQEVGGRYLFTSEAARAIPDFEAERRLLKETAERPGQPLSRKAQIQIRLAGVDLNLWNACDPVLFERAELRRELMLEAFAICDKLSLVDPLRGSLPYIYAHASAWTAYFREQESGGPDLNLLRKAEALWAEVFRVAPQLPAARGYLVLVRRWLAAGLAAQDRREEAEGYRRICMDTARNDGDLLFQIALECLRFAYASGPANSAVASGSRGSNALCGRFEREAMSVLREAVAAGFRDAALMRGEPLLARLRPSAEFQVLLFDVGFPAQPFAGLTRPVDGSGDGKLAP
jgi:serine/threonine protein kinase